LKPVVAIYSTFLQRSYDEIVHDVCLQNLPVIFAIDRAGIVGDDGPTHNGTFDLSYLRHIPNLVVMAPKDGFELMCMLRTALSHNGPCAIRYPRGSAADSREEDEPEDIPIGKAEVLREGENILIIAAGNMVDPAYAASQLLSEAGINACVINARFVKPLDMDLIAAHAGGIKHILTVEENAVSGGFGSAVVEELVKKGIDGLTFKILGLPDRFIEQGPQALLRKDLGLDAEGIAKEALDLIGRKTSPSGSVKANN
jgi:1-deoxy-D-xylulose-5-phosphate synthase